MIATPTLSLFSSPNRVRFADAPSEISGKYGTSDGHSLDEGRGVVPVRCSDRKWVARITPSEVRQLESELGEEYQASLDRLKRRWGPGWGSLFEWRR